MCYFGVYSYFIMRHLAIRDSSCSLGRGGLGGPLEFWWSASFQNWLHIWAIQVWHIIFISILNVDTTPIKTAYLCCEPSIEPSSYKSKTFVSKCLAEWCMQVVTGGGTKSEESSAWPRKENCLRRLVWYLGQFLSSKRLKLINCGWVSLWQ